MVLWTISTGGLGHGIHQQQMRTLPANISVNGYLIKWKHFSLACMVFFLNLKGWLVSPSALCQPGFPQRGLLEHRPLPAPAPRGAPTSCGLALLATTGAACKQQTPFSIIFVSQSIWLRPFSSYTKGSGLKETKWSPSFASSLLAEYWLPRQTVAPRKLASVSVKYCNGDCTVRQHLPWYSWAYSVKKHLECVTRKQKTERLDIQGSFSEVSTSAYLAKIVQRLHTKTLFTRQFIMSDQKRCVCTFGVYFH